MPASNNSALALAGQLRALGDAELAELLGAREIREHGIRDFFDLADALLDPASIQQALARLDRPTLSTLAALGELGTVKRADAATTLAAKAGGTAALDAQLAAALRLALITDVGGSIAVPASVAQQFEEWEELPSLQDLRDAPAPTPLAPVSGTDTRFTDTVSAEHAFTTTTAIAELIAELQHESARELARGGIALPDSKRLASAMSVELDAVPGLVEIASRAALAALDAGRLMPTEATTAWLDQSTGARWADLAGAWLRGVPGDIRAILGSTAHATWGDRLQDYANWLYPAGGEWMRERVAAYSRDAELLGITAHQVPSTPGIALLAEGQEQASAAMTALLPPEVESVYLQHDLSIVSPGPLAPRLDGRLRTMADVEGRALASTYRVSTASLYRAMAAGETAESIREFLGGISLTGIPQPLEYLVREATARYGLVRVGDVDGGRSYVRSADDTMLRTLLVDHGIAPLGLTRAGDRLLSRFDLEVVFWTLSDARYPVAAENAKGEVVVLKRPRAARAAPVEVVNPAIGLIDRLRVGSSADPDVTGKAWLSRQLDVAIRGKLGLTVTVQLQDGSTIDYQLEPASVAGGRLRARDRKSDIERTLPLSSITAVGPAL